jgi:hypothetical protein
MFTLAFTAWWAPSATMSADLDLLWPSCLGVRSVCARCVEQQQHLDLRGVNCLLYSMNLRPEGKTCLVSVGHRAFKASSTSLTVFAQSTE